MIRTGLGNLRRTHYSDQLDPAMDGQDVVLMGWVESVRGHGNISFVSIRDKKWSIPSSSKKR